MSILRVSRLALAALLTSGLAVSACGGGGVPDPAVDQGKYLDQLTPSEFQTLCTWQTEIDGGDSTRRSCGNGTSAQFSSTADCIANPEKVHCTVGAMEACVRATGTDPCKGLTEPACMSFLSCVFSSPK